MNGSQLDEIARKLWDGRVTDADQTAFLQHLIIANKVDNLPLKAQDALYSKAWQLGHSGGYAEVETVYGDLAELVLAVYRATLEQLEQSWKEGRA